MPEITVGELIDKIKDIDRDATVSFSGLEFNRIKWQSDSVIQAQFVEQVYRDASGNVVVENLEK